LIFQAAKIRKLIVINLNFLKLPVHVDIKAVELIVVLYKSNCVTAELFSTERESSGLKVSLFWIKWLDDGGDHSEMFLEDIVVLTEQSLIEAFF